MKLSVLYFISQKYRLVMMLHYVEGFTVSEISQILEISEGTGSRLARGRDSLTDIYDLRKRRANI
ncbi:MAG: sigma factor-like helix-turn-helix DNA-binding protein [Lachnospiraceae bacterium]